MVSEKFKKDLVQRQFVNVMWCDVRVLDFHFMRHIPCLLLQLLSTVMPIAPRNVCNDSMHAMHVQLAKTYLCNALFKLQISKWHWNKAFLGCLYILLYCKVWLTCLNLMGTLCWVALGALCVFRVQFMPQRITSITEIDIIGSVAFALFWITPKIILKALRTNNNKRKYSLLP